MIHRLKNTPVRELIRALEQDGFQYKRRKGSHRVIATTMDDVLLFIFIMPKTPYLPVLLKASSTKLNGMKATLKRLKLIV